METAHENRSIRHVRLNVIKVQLFLYCLFRQQYRSVQEGVSGKMRPLGVDLHFELTPLRLQKNALQREHKVNGTNVCRGHLNTLRLERFETNEVDSLFDNLSFRFVTSFKSA